MRQRFAVVLAAGGRWPDAEGGRNLPCFSWVKVDNRGLNPVDLGLNSNPVGGDKIDTLMSIGGRKRRVFNVAGPRGPGDDDPDAGESWPSQLHLVSPNGTTVNIEIADHPIVDIESPSEALVAAVVNTSSGGNAQQFANLGGVAGALPVVTKLMIMGLGATGATEVNATLTGTISNQTINIPVAVPAGVTTPITPVILDFGSGIPCSAVGGTITLTLPAFGAGNTLEQAVLVGYLM